MQRVKIPGFMPLCNKYGSEDYVMKDTTLVIDGQNYLFRLYEETGCPSKFGMDCDDFASYLRSNLGRLKAANNKLYFLFRGGPEVISDERFERDMHVLGSTEINTLIFMKEVCIEVLDELMIDYVVCEHEAKNDAIALATTLNCPVVSSDNRFCFSHVSYISYRNIKSVRGPLETKIFTLERFMNKLNIKIGHVTIFFVIYEVQYFDKIIFKDFFKYMHTDNMEKVLKWMSNHSVDGARNILFKFIDEPNRSKFLQYEEEALRLISNDIGKSVALQYLENRNTFNVSPGDREWFTKGVSLNRVPIKYVNLYHSKVMFGSWTFEDFNDEDALLLSRHIIRYAYDLLTNFDDSTFMLCRNNFKEVVGTDYSISRPEGCADDGSESVFSLGWDSQPRLFEHFLQTHLGTDFDVLSALSDDVQLVAVAAVYLARARGAACRPQIYAVFACCAALRSKVLPKKLPDKIVDKSLLHPLVQFQHCLQQLNFLNVLCGWRLTPTKYAGCYNATLVYSLAVQAAEEMDPRLYLRELLLECSASPDVVQLYDSLVDYYDSNTDYSTFQPSIRSRIPIVDPVTSIRLA